MSAEEIQNWLVAISLVVTTVVTIILQVKSNKNNQKEFLDRQLIELQRMSFYDPFVEDKDFTETWLELKEKYINKRISEQEKNQFLKYEVYTEMLFNFLEMSCKIYKKEKDLLNYVDFKSWVNTHKAAWKSPLQTNSNKEVYGEKIFNLVNSWIDW